MRSKIFYSLISLLLACSGIFSQDISREVIGVGGGVDDNGKINISWTMGEANVNTLHSPYLILTQGFQQSSITFLNNEEKWVNDNWEFIIFPNPTHAYIQLDITQAPDVDTPLEAEIIDMSGRKLIQNIPLHTHQENSIDVQQLPVGNYLLKVQESGQLPVKTFAFIKTK